MNAQIDRQQTWANLIPLASPGVRRVVVLVNVVQFWPPGLQTGARTPDQINKTEHFVETKRSFSLFVASTDRLAASQLANLTVFKLFWSTFLRRLAEQKQRFRSRLSHFLFA